MFDRISVVADRYGVPKDKRKFVSRLEVYQLSRPISAMGQGGTLRIVDPQPFEVTWTTDDWATTNKTLSKSIGLPSSFVDITVAADAHGRLEFALFWPATNQWLGRNIQVSINAQPTATMAAEVKPRS